MEPSLNIRVLMFWLWWVMSPWAIRDKIFFRSIFLCSCIHIQVYISCDAGAHGGQRSPLASLELEAVVNCLAWVLRTKLRASGRRARVCYCWTIFSAPKDKFVTHARQVLSLWATPQSVLFSQVLENIFLKAVLLKTCFGSDSDSKEGVWRRHRKRRTQIRSEGELGWLSAYHLLKKEYTFCTLKNPIIRT